MTQDEYKVGSLENGEKFAIIRMARELATRHGSRMCDEDGETHGEELYCVGVEDIAEIIKQVAAHVTEALTKSHEAAFQSYVDQAKADRELEALAARLDEREACAKVCEQVGQDWNYHGIAAAIRARSRARSNNDN